MGSKPFEIGNVLFGSSIDSLQTLPFNDKLYLYYEYYMAGGNQGNYDIVFGLYDLDSYVSHSIDYEYDPENSEGEIEAQFIPSKSLASFPDLSAFLEKKARSSSRVVSGDVSIKIPRTKSVMTIESDYRQHIKTPLNATQKTASRLDNIQKELRCSDCKFYNGKIFYQGEKGKIASFIVVVPDHATWEYLVSYDAKGNYKNSMIIGGVMLYAGDSKESVVEGNKIISHNTWLGEPGEDEGESFEHYVITSDLKFVKSN